MYLNVEDIDATLRCFIVHNFVDNYDSYTCNMVHNYYLYQAQDGKLSMLPWDYNLAFGAFNAMGIGGNMQGNQMPGGIGGNMQGNQMPADGRMQMPQMAMNGDATSMVNMAIDTPILGSAEEDRPMWSQLINNSTYKDMYHQLFDEFISTYIESASIIEEINRVQEMIAPYVQKDPTAFYNQDQFNTAVDTLKEFINLRGESIRGQLNGTIPSTTEEQEANKEKLIDTAHIDILDMGTQAELMQNNR